MRRALVTGIAACLALGLPTLPPAAAQDNCIPEGEAYAPIPWAQQLLDQPRVWPLATGKGQRIAVVSTGVATNPQLARAVAASTDLAPPPEFGEESGRADCLGIGTAVAGVIAARPQGGIGFKGVAPGADVLSAKVVGDQFPNRGNSREAVAPQQLAAGIDWARGQGATVIVVPSIATADSKSLRAAVQRAHRAGILVVASVGDADDENAAAVTPYPAAHDAVIGVGAIAKDGAAGLSRAAHVDLVAPGAEIVTTFPGDGLGPLSGTGLAAAYVAGAAALVRSHFPEASPDEVAQRMFASATPAHEGVGSRRYGHGIVNPYNAVLDRVVDDEPSPLPSLSPKVIPAEVLAQRAATERSNSFAALLAGAGLALAALATAVVVFGPRGRRRRWRAGLSTVPEDRPEDENPEPPVELFGDQKPPGAS